MLLLSHSVKQLPDPDPTPSLLRFYNFIISGQPRSWSPHHEGDLVKNTIFWKVENVPTLFCIGSWMNRMIMIYLLLYSSSRFRVLGLANCQIVIWFVYCWSPKNAKDLLKFWFELQVMVLSSYIPRCRCQWLHCPLECTTPQGHRFFSCNQDNCVVVTAFGSLVSSKGNIWFCRACTSNIIWTLLVIAFVVVIPSGTCARVTRIRVECRVQGVHHYSLIRTSGSEIRSGRRNWKLWNSWWEWKYLWQLKRF